MAEPFSITAGAVGIAAAFSACVDCFGYVQLGRRLHALNQISGGVTCFALRTRPQAGLFQAATN